GVAHDLGQQGPGAHTFSFDVGPLVCVDGGANYVVTATAATDCPPAVTTEPQTVHVDCKVKPCVSFSLNPVGPLCEGADVTVSATVNNCTPTPAGAEDITVSINGVAHDLGQVAPGSQAFSFDLGPLVCVNGGADYVVSASASTDCPPAANAAPQT